MSNTDIISVLLVEDNEGDAKLVSLYLQAAEHHKFELEHVTSLGDAIATLNTTSYKLILLDLSLPDASGINTVTGITTVAPYTAVVVMTGIYDGLLAADAISAGAQDFLVKGDANTVLLERTITNAMQRTEVHKQLQKSQESHQAVMESSNDAIITTDELGIIQTWNRAACEIFKYSSKDMIGAKCEKIFSEKSKDDFVRHFKNCLIDKHKKRQADLIELEGIRSNNKFFPLEISYSSWHIEEGVFTSIVIKDITERRKIEQLKNEFVSTVSHELRTPLTAIMGSLQLITGGVVGTIPEQIRNMLEVAVNNGERLLLIINDILDMNKIESNNMSFNIQRVDVMKLVNQALTENQSYAEKNNTVLELDQTQPGKFLNVDYARMLQILANLISNASKFSPPNGVVTINVTKISNNIRIAVQDQGSGIPQEFHHRIFQKFAQADSTDTRAPGGTGLGLSISKSMIENMGGAIDFESEPNVKTTFFVDIPLMERKE